MDCLFAKVQKYEGLNMIENKKEKNSPGEIFPKKEIH